MAANDSPSPIRIGPMIWMMVFLVMIAMLVFGAYYGALSYIAWRYNATWSFAWPDVSTWLALMRRLPLAMILEMSVIGGISLLLSLIPLRIALASFRKSRQTLKGIDDLHGSARWANASEIRESELLPPPAPKARGKSALPPAHDGVVVGGWQRSRRAPVTMLKDNGKNHILLFAPTRAGKGVSVVLPTLLAGWNESALVYDPKGEAWAYTSGFRKDELGQRVFKFDPTSMAEDVAKFNPLAEVRIDTQHEVPDCQNIAQMLVDPDGKGVEQHWPRTAMALLSAVILHVCIVAHRRNKRASFAEVEAWFGDPGDSMERKLKSLITYGHRTNDNGQKEAHPMIAREAQSNLDRDIKERSSVISTALSYLTLYRDPIIAKNTGRSDWTIDDLIDSETPATVYFVVRPGDQERTRPLIRLILTQIVRKLTHEIDFSGAQGQSPTNRRLLLLLDEFTSLKRLAIVEEALPYLAGYGVKCLIVCQDLKQLLAVYGREESLVSNCAVRACFAPNNIETAKLISEWAGDKTIVAKRFSRSGKRSKLAAESVSESVAEHKRRLINPDEVMRLPGAQKDRNGNIVAPGDMIVFTQGQYPIYAKQYLYFQDPELKRRKEIPAPEKSDSSDPRTLKIRAKESKDRANPVLRSSHDNTDVNVNVGGAAGAN